MCGEQPPRSPSQYGSGGSGIIDNSLTDLDNICQLHAVDLVDFCNIGCGSKFYGSLGVLEVYGHGSSLLLDALILLLAIEEIFLIDHSIIGDGGGGHLDSSIVGRIHQEIERTHVGQ